MRQICYQKPYTRKPVRGKTGAGAVVKKTLVLVMVFVSMFGGAACSKRASNDRPPTALQLEKPTTANTTQPSDCRMSESAKQLGITHQNYPKIDGSTSTLSIARAINRNMYLSSDNENYPDSASKTVASYRLLMDAKVDMVLVPYASPDILREAADKGVQLEFYPIAAEALVFITPKDNQTANISEEQVRSIYLSDGIKNWADLGGPDKALIPICRNSDSGSQSQMDNLVLKGEKMHPSISKNYVELTMEGMLEQVAFFHTGGLNKRPTDSYAIGYTLYTYLKSMGDMTGIDERLNMLSYEGVFPSETTMANGTYPLTDSYYAVLRDDTPDEHCARKLVGWLKSADGRSMIKDLGLIPK